MRFRAATTKPVVFVDKSFQFSPHEIPELSNAFNEVKKWLAFNSLLMRFVADEEASSRKICSFNSLLMRF